MPKEELENITRYMEIIKRDHTNLKREQDEFNQRINRISEKSADMELLNSIKSDIAKAISKSEKAGSLVGAVDKINDKLARIEAQNSSEMQRIKDEINRINIKAESTSKILRDLEKVL